MRRKPLSGSSFPFGPAFQTKNWPSRPQRLQRLPINLRSLVFASAPAQAWLLQAWVPTITEWGLQMQRLGANRMTLGGPHALNLALGRQKRPSL